VLDQVSRYRDPEFERRGGRQDYGDHLERLLE